jgi:hypothetical protein
MASLSHQKPMRLSKVLLLQSTGFLVILVMIWMDPALLLASRFLDHPAVESVDLPGLCLQSILILTVWLFVTGSTRRLLIHLQTLEGFMRVCSWCRKIDYKGQWMPFEEFLSQGFDTPTTHGICGQCLDEQRKASKAHNTEVNCIK